MIGTPADLLCKDALINRKRERRLMKVMGIITIYPKPNLSKRYHAQYVKPYLLRNINLGRPNQVANFRFLLEGF